MHLFGGCSDSCKMLHSMPIVHGCAISFYFKTFVKDAEC